MEAAKLTSKDIWQKALDTLRSTRRQTLIITAAGLVLPQVADDLWFDASGARAAADMRTLFETHAGVRTAFWELVAPVIAFAMPFFFASLMVFIVAIGAYFALVDLAVQHMRNGEMVTVGTAVRNGLGAALKRLPGLFALVLVLGFFGQVLVAPAIIVAVLGLIIPVLVVAERKGAFRAALDAVTVRYARRTAFRPLAVAFNLLSLGATFYFILMLVALGIEQFLALDQRIPALRALWSVRFGALPIGPVYLVATIVESLALTATVALMPAVTTALYFTVAARREIARV